MKCFAGGWPRAFCSSVVDAAAASCCSDSMAHHTDGWLRSTNALQRSAYSTLGPVVAIQRDDVHVPGGHREQRRQRTQRDAQNRGAVVSRCSRSLAASVACRFPPRSRAAPRCMPSTTSDSGRKAMHTLVIHKGESVRGRKCPSPAKSLTIFCQRFKTYLFTSFFDSFWTGLDLTCLWRIYQ